MLVGYRKTLPEISDKYVRSRRKKKKSNMPFKKRILNDKIAE